MRKIKFTGFHKDQNGQTVIILDDKKITGFWCYGDLSTDGGYFINEHAVIPETIGQYIDLKDKNNKEIYEGHKVLIDFGESIHKTEFIVKYEDYRFILKNDYAILYLGKLLGERRKIDFNIEIIGHCLEI